MPFKCWTLYWWSESPLNDEEIEDLFKDLEAEATATNAASASAAVNAETGVAPSEVLNTEWSDISPKAFRLLDPESRLLKDNIILDKGVICQLALVKEAKAFWWSQVLGSA